MIYAFLANGLEEVECLAVVDILRRAKEEVKLVSITGDYEVTGSHSITIKADALIGDVDFAEADLLFLPGGLPGTTNLGNCHELCAQLKQFHRDGKRVAAICAAPSVLGGLGILQGKKATSYPGFEEQLLGAVYTGAGVVTDGNVTTARGLGYAIELGLELVALLQSREKSDAIREAIQFQYA